MSLIGRLLEADVAGGRRKIPVSHLVAGLRLLRAGKLTRARIIADLQLDAGETADFDALVTKLLAAGDQNAMLEGILDVLSVAERRQFGLDTEAKVAAAVTALG
jgi:hypothetical protein